MSQQVEAEPGYSCAVCLEDFSTKVGLHMIEKDPVCGDCVDRMLPMFEDALKHEHHYPPKFGSVSLAIDDFAYKFDSDFVKRYRRAVLEYKTPFADRIYCTHKIRAANAPAKGGLAPRGARLALQQHEIDGLVAFGAKVTECGAFVTGRRQRPGTKLLCYRCMGDVCCNCRKPLQSPTEFHNCIPPPKHAIDLEREGQKRGVDYQLCPGDQVPIGLQDGCNAMRCTYCSTEFCFLCGERASHDSGHWKAGSKCPRFGKPDARNAIFDRVAPAEVPVADRNHAHDIAQQLLAQFGEHLAANLRGDDNWARGLIEEVRAENGEDMWALILQEVMAVEPMVRVQAFNERLRNEVEAFAAAHRAEAENMEQQAQAGAQNQTHVGAANQAPARDELLHVDGVPDLLHLQLMAMVEENLVFDHRFTPVNEPARGWIERHVRVLRVIEAVGAHDLHQRLPHLERAWHTYLARIPPQFAVVMIR